MIGRKCYTGLLLGVVLLGWPMIAAAGGQGAVFKEPPPAVDTSMPDLPPPAAPTTEPPALTAPAATTSPVNTPPYRPYFYNYPHEIPADYVFRTERVFSPQGMGGGLFSGFAGSNASPVAANAALSTAVHNLAQRLLTGTQEEIADEYTVAVSTFVNLNNLYATSALGRYVGEQMIGELRGSGIAVIDVRKTPGIMVSRYNGEYSLSRDMKELRYIQNAQAMLVGTYTVAEGRVFLNARLLRNADNMVLAAATLEIPMDAVVAGMLADEGMPASKATPVAVRAFGKR